MAVEELSKRTGTDEQLDKFDIKKAKKGSLLLDLSASPDVLRSPETLRAAIRDDPVFSPLLLSFYSH